MPTLNQEQEKADTVDTNEKPIIQGEDPYDKVLRILSRDAKKT